MDRVRVLPAYLATIETLASDRLVWLVVEDLPWVDAPSRDLLSYLAHGLHHAHLLVLATVRTNDPATDTDIGALVDALTALDGAERLALSPLGPLDAAGLVADLTSESAPAEAVDRVVAAGQGSPLLLEQLVAAGLDSAASSTAPVSRPMLARIQRLDPDTLRLVQLAAVGDGLLSHRLLRAAYAAPEPTFDEAVERALDAGLLRFLHEDRSYTFAHPLLRNVAEDTLAPGDRLRAHRRWGEVLSAEENHHDEARLLVAAAHHWHAADDDTESFRAALTAARVTFSLGAANETADLLLRAWQLWDRVADPAARSDRTHDDLLLDLQNALENAGRIGEAVDLLERELDRASHEADALRTLCLRLNCADTAEVMGRPPGPEVYADAPAAARELLAAPARRLLLLALNAIGYEFRWTEPELSYRLHAKALQDSWQVGCSDEIVWAAGVMVDQLVTRGRHDEAMDVCEEASRACVGVLDHMAVENSRAFALGESGQFRAAAAQSKRTLARLPDPSLKPLEWSFAATAAAEWLGALGEWDQVATLLAQCADLEGDQWAHRLWALTASSEFACARGDIEKAARLADQAWEEICPGEESRWFMVRLPVRQARSSVAAARGSYNVAIGLLLPMLVIPGIETEARLWSAAQIAAGAAGDWADTVTNALADPSASETTSVISAAIERLPRTGPYLTARYLQARADLARAKKVATPDTWAEVREAWRELEHVPAVGWASLRLAEALLRAGERSATTEPLMEAWDISRRLGARPLTDAAANLARRARIAISAAEPSPAPQASRLLARLTDRELEVLRHVALGMSNEEIATALFISPKTASVHVSRILAKLGVPSRAKATVIAIENGLDVHSA